MTEFAAEVGIVDKPVSFLPELANQEQITDRDKLYLAVDRILAQEGDNASSTITGKPARGG
jgi:hypothetical protein